MRRKCPVCNRPARAMYRNKPKGEIAVFVCINCLPDDMVPPDDLQDEVLEIERTINQRGTKASR